jgi:hypothetical protein
MGVPHGGRDDVKLSLGGRCGLVLLQFSRTTDTSSTVSSQVHISRYHGSLRKGYMVKSLDGTEYFLYLAARYLVQAICDLESS